MFSLQYSLARLIEEEWGIWPHAVMGYSNGEIAAAVVSGVMTLEDVCKIFKHVQYRDFVAGVGGMAVVGDVSWDVLHQIIVEVGEPLLVVSAIYSDTSYMISGPANSVKEAQTQLENAGHLNVTILETPYAAHSFLHRVRQFGSFLFLESAVKLFSIGNR